MSELQTLKTAIHEIAHAKLHDIDLNAPKDEQQPRVDRRTREVEAESVAYTVCQHYGLDTSDYSFGYVAGWSSGRELAELKSSLERSALPPQTSSTALTDISRSCKSSTKPRKPHPILQPRRSNRPKNPLRTCRKKPPQSQKNTRPFPHRRKSE